MLVTFQKFHREICLATLVLFGLACGHLAATVLELKLQPEVSPAAKNAPVASSPKRVKDSGELNFILRNNLFDPQSRGELDISLARGSSPPGEQAAGDRKDLTLFGTMVAGAESVALIKVERDIKLYHIGEEVPGDGRIEAVERNRVMIRNRDQSLSTLSLPENAQAGQGGRGNDAPGSGISSVGPNRWKISRNRAESAREGIAQQLRLAQMEPHITNGKTDGFVIKTLNRRSLLVDMGLLRGDVVKKVNDMKLDSPEKALQVMQQLREARRVTVDIERFDEPMTFTYELE